MTTSLIQSLMVAQSELPAAEVADFSPHSFVLLDWVVLIGYMALVSVLGVKLAGKQKDMQDFFRGGDKLPWYAVSGSMIATIISAVTFVAVPAVAFRDDGNFTYLQLGIIGGFLARGFVAFALVPAYYEHRVYSPYDYMGRQLGESARTVTTVMFTLLGVMAQAARVYLTAMILELVLADELAWWQATTGMDPLVTAVTIVGIIAVIWTLLGGVATVIWTDVMLFGVFVFGGLAALGVIVSQLPGGFGQLWDTASAAGKFELFDLDGVAGDAELPPGPAWMNALTSPYTAWAAFFAVTFGNIGSYGTDQLVAQRIFCCKSQRDAKLAIMSSYAAELVVGLMLLVGVGLWVYYGQFPERLTGVMAEKVAENTDNIFPAFILTVVPPGLTGLIVAGIFAAAISSLTSILAALAQTSVSAVYLPLRKIDIDDPEQAQRHGKEVLRVSRGLIVFWGIVLCVVSFVINAYVEAMNEAGKDVPFLDLALGLASYVVGALLATFLLAWLPLRVSAYGLLWSAPLSVMMVWAARFHDATVPASVSGWFGDAWDGHRFLTVSALVALAVVLSWIVAALLGDAGKRRKRLWRTPWAVLGGVMLVAMSLHGWFPTYDAQGQWVTDEAGAYVKRIVAWPWYAVIGGFTAFVFGYLLSDFRDPSLIKVPTARPTPALRAAATSESEAVA